MEFHHQSGDRFLGILSRLDGLVGGFVKAFPGTSSGQSLQDWIDEWFINRVRYYFDHNPEMERAVAQAEQLSEILSSSEDTLITNPVRLVSIQPHYFRGFRELSAPVVFNSNLVVVDGRNSSGKTSLAEAMEWLLTGGLIRRSLQVHGSPRELENFISNQLKPEDEKTWVEAEFILVDSVRLRLKRVLTEDYGTASTSRAESVLLADGAELTLYQEHELLDELFAGIPPLLMQHSLRLFVHSTPSQRRDYFERLLRLDELTQLIGIAVIGDSRLAEFPSPLGSVAWTRWEQIYSTTKSRNSKTILIKAQRAPPDDLLPVIADALAVVACAEFPDLVQPEAEFDQIKSVISGELMRERQRAFPLLDQLRPKQVLDEKLRASFSGAEVKQNIEKLHQDHKTLTTAQSAVQSVGNARIAISRAFDNLVQAGLIDLSEESQICQMCDYQAVPTLTLERIREVETWQPMQQAITQAEKEFNEQFVKVTESVTELQSARTNLIPGLIPDEEWEAALNEVAPSVRDTADQFRRGNNKAYSVLEPFDGAIENFSGIIENPETADQRIDQASAQIAILLSELDNVVEEAEKYAEGFKEIDKAIGSLTREDATYAFMETWSLSADDLQALETDIKWEQAKIKAQKELKKIRDFLLSSRQRLLDASRIDFSAGMNEVWQSLRADRYSAFSNLSIPEPRGKGFPVEIEVKAVLDDGRESCEVDALRVFSESQINALGIAAFVTRSRLLGHSIVMFDDPVQSMDEEHFKTFSQELIPLLLGSGFQVIILTHNETFAREVSYSCAELSEYTTMTIRHSRRKGCQIDEGNRRVAERLKIAEKKGDEGELKDAWLYVRLALERLYTVVYLKYGPESFTPLSWIDQTSEYMWNNGVGDIIEGKTPGEGTRLKEILDMAIGGAHDRSPYGSTDLTRAIYDLRSLLPRLQIGAG